MEKCSIIATPDNVLKFLKKEGMLENILIPEGLSVLDIGCRNPEYLYVLYHDLNFNYLEGIELTSEKEAVSEYLRFTKMNDDIDSKSIYDLYVKYLKFDGTEIEGRGFHIKEKEFLKIFRLHFETSAQEFFNNSNSTKKYDMIILADVLHLNPRHESLRILRSAIGSLTTGGLIYVKVNHSDNILAQKMSHFTYTEEEFNNLLIEFTPIYSCKKVDDETQKIISMIFLGSKKSGT